MSRMVGTVSRGVRAPIIRNGDNIVDIVTASVLEAAKEDGFEIATGPSTVSVTKFWTTPFTFPVVAIYLFYFLLFIVNS